MVCCLPYLVFTCKGWCIAGSSLIIHGSSWDRMEMNICLHGIFFLRDCHFPMVQVVQLLRTCILFQHPHQLLQQSKRVRCKESFGYSLYYGLCYATRAVMKTLLAEDSQDGNVLDPTISLMKPALLTEIFVNNLK